MQRFLRILFAMLVARPVTLLALGVNVRNRDGLPHQGPAIIAANHNSHLDTLALLSLFPLNTIHCVQPAAAADYFFSRPWLARLLHSLIGIVPILRSDANGKQDPLAACHRVLAQENILILFPEGTRGEPEVMQKLKSGIAHLAMRHPHVPIIPVFMHGLGRAMPKGERLLVPFFCDILIGRPMLWGGNRHDFMQQLEDEFLLLRSQLSPASSTLDSTP